MHIGARCNPHRWLFDSPAERARFLALLEEIAEEHGWTIWAYCLMGTHYHVLVRAEVTALSAGMQRLNTALAKMVKRRDGVRGDVFDGRFFCVPVTTLGHARRAIRYIALNPVKEGLVEDPSDWPWSNYAAMLRGEGAASDEIREVVGGPEALAAFVDAGRDVELPDDPAELAHDRRPLESLVTAEPDTWWLAHRRHGYSISDIARQVGRNKSNVSRAIRLRDNRNDGV